MARKKREFNVGCYLKQKGYNKHIANEINLKSGLGQAFLKEFYEPMTKGELYRFENGRPINLKEDFDKTERDYYNKKI